MTALLTPALIGQIINLFAAVLLLVSFAMLAQRRILSLIDLFAAQGLVLCLSTAFVAWATGQTHLYWSAGLTFVLKVLLLPWILHRLIRRLDVKWDVETLINIPTTMLIGHRARDLRLQPRAADVRARRHGRRGGTLGIALAACCSRS